MKQTKDKSFVDSNILLYLLSNDDRKKNIAKTILKTRPIISTQVVSENINVLLKKFKELSSEDVHRHANILLTYCIVKPVTAAVITQALELKTKYLLQWYDSTIIASALIQQCTIIYSEDFQPNQLIDGKLRVINPFVI